MNMKWFKRSPSHNEKEDLAKEDLNTEDLATNKVLVYSDSSSHLYGGSITNEVNKYLDKGWTVKETKMQMNRDKEDSYTVIVFVLEKPAPETEQKEEETNS